MLCTYTHTHTHTTTCTPYAQSHVMRSRLRTRDYLLVNVAGCMRILPTSTKAASTNRTPVSTAPWLTIGCEFSRPNSILRAKSSFRSSTVCALPVSTQQITVPSKTRKHGSHKQSRPCPSHRHRPKSNNCNSISKACWSKHARRQQASARRKQRTYQTKCVIHHDACCMIVDHTLSLTHSLTPYSEYHQ
jgi:hypothetical protein